MGYLAWTDSDGAATLSNLKARPARRFTSWTPDVDRVSDRRTALGSGIVYEFLYRKDYVATLRIDHLPVTQSALFLRFKDFAMQGCEFYVYTEDAQDRVYLCRLRPGTAPTMEMSSSPQLEYSVTVDVMSAEDTPVPLLCHYRE